MTSLQTLKPGKFSWDGDNAVSNIDVQNKSLGDCAGVSKLQLMAMPCDEKQNFMCEKGLATSTTTKPTPALTEAAAAVAAVAAAAAPPEEYYLIFIMPCPNQNSWIHFFKTII